MQQMLITQGSRLQSPDFPFSPLEELSLILRRSPLLNVKETKNKLIPALGGWRLICTKDEWHLTNGSFPQAVSGELCAHVNAHAHTYSHAMCAPPSDLPYPNVSCLSPCLRDRLRKEQNERISVCLVVFFFFFFPLSLSRPPVFLSCLHWLPICSMKLSCVVNIFRIYCKMCAWNDFFSFSVSLQRVAWMASGVIPTLGTNTRRI